MFLFIVGKYPTFEWGVNFLFGLQHNRITTEVDKRDAIREKKAQDASKLEQQAKISG